MKDKDARNAIKYAEDRIKMLEERYYELARKIYIIHDHLGVQEQTVPKAEVLIKKRLHENTP